jgi:endonuclease/exonuclease/phosphatase (EEP) superfamily protein YafD
MIRSQREGRGTQSMDEKRTFGQTIWCALRWTSLILGWAIVGLLGVLAILRIVAWDEYEPLVVVNALTFIVYLPAWVVGTTALLRKRWWLSVSAIAIVAAQVSFVAPELLAGTTPAWTAYAPKFRVFDANIDQSNIFESGYVSAIKNDHPNILTLEEFHPGALNSMKASGILTFYPHQCVKPYLGAVGFLLASEWPLRHCEFRTISHGYNKTLGTYYPIYYMVEATMSTPWGNVAIRVVHTLAPFPSYSKEWELAMTAINRTVRNQGSNRMLMVGDFNATWNNRLFASLLGDGLIDGAAALGEEFQMTWPNGAIVPPFVRIDHVLTGSHLAVTRMSTGTGYGSDHRFVLATVAIQK